MAKLYTKNTWVDEVLTEAALHEITDPAGDPIPGSVTDLTTAIAALNSLLDILATGSKISLLTDVAVAGTALTAARMNNIEDGVDALDTLLDSVNNSGITYLCQGRLTLQSGVAISASEQADKTNVYFTPYNGNFLDLYDGTKWVRHTFAELTLAVGAFTASKPNDIFVYNNAGTLTLSATEWTNASTRATALALKDGIYVKNGATTYRYLGTIYIDAAQKCQDTLLEGYVWNYYNRVPRRLFMSEATAHTYNGATRLWNNSETNNRFGMVVGIADFISIAGLARLNAGADNSYAFTYYYIDGGLSGYFAGNYNLYVTMGGSSMNIAMAAGYHYINVYENGNHNSSNFIAVFTYASFMR